MIKNMVVEKVIPTTEFYKFAGVLGFVSMFCAAGGAHLLLMLPLWAMAWYLTNEPWMWMWILQGAAVGLGCALCNTCVRFVCRH